MASLGISGGFNLRDLLLDDEVHGFEARCLGPGVQGTVPTMTRESCLALVLTWSFDVSLLDGSASSFGGNNKQRMRPERGFIDPP